MRGREAVSGLSWLAYLTIMAYYIGGRFARDGVESDGGTLWYAICVFAGMEALTFGAYCCGMRPPVGVLATAMDRKAYGIKPGNPSVDARNEAEESRIDPDE